MSEPIKIVVTAETAQAAAALRDFVAQGNSGLNVLAKGGAVASTELTKLRETALATHEGFRTLESSVLLLGGARFPELSMGVVGATEAMRGIRSVAMLTGASLATILPIAGAIGAVLALGGIGWYSYSDSMDEAKNKAKETADALEKIPDILKKISDAQKAGVLTPDIADKYKKMLSGETPLFTGDPYTQMLHVFSPTKQHQDLLADLASGEQTVSTDRDAVATGSGGRARQLAPDEVQAAVSAMLKKDGALDVSDKTTSAIDALGKIKDLQKQLTDETLTGFAKQRQAADDTYKKQIADFTDWKRTVEAQLLADPKNTKLIDAASTVSAAGRQIDDSHNQVLANINADEQKEIMRQQAEAESKIRIQNATEAKEQIAELERQISLTEAQEGDKRGQNYFSEYVQRVALYTKLQLEGKITEDEYTANVTDAQTKALDGQKKVNDELERSLQLKQEIARSDAEVALKKINDNPLLTSDQKRQQSIPVIQTELDTTADDISAQHDIAANPDTTDQARAQALEKINQLMIQQHDLQLQLNAAQDANNFGAQIGQVLVKLASVPTLAQQTAGVIENTYNAALASISSNITGLVEGTKTWGQALLGIYRDVVGELIQGFVHMATEFILQHVIMASAKRLFDAMMISTTATTDAAGTAITAAGSETRGLATVKEGEKKLFSAAMGAANAVSSIPYVGWALALAAFASVEAAGNALLLASGGSFASGGYTGDGGRNEVAGLVHRGEFVVPADAVDRIGIGNLHAMTAGAQVSRGGAGGMQSGRSQSSPTNLHLAMFGGEDAANRWANSQDGEVWFFNMLKRHAYKFEHK